MIDDIKHTFVTYFNSNFSQLLEITEGYMYFVKIWNQWFSARLQYLKCISNGDTAVLLIAIELVPLWNIQKQSLGLSYCYLHGARMGYMVVVSARLTN